MLAAGTEKGTICLRDSSTGRELGRREAHQGQTTALTFSPDGTTLASGDSHGVVRLWNISRLSVMN
jgi:WD40 repeat protein